MRKRENKLDFYQKAYITNELYHYWDNKKIIKELEEEIYEASPLPPDGQPRGNETSNPTESKAIKLTQEKSTRRVLLLYRNIDAIERARNRLSLNELQVADLIFKEGKTQIYCQMNNYISKDQYYDTRNKLIYLVAQELGEI